MEAGGTTAPEDRHRSGIVINDNIYSTLAEQLVKEDRSRARAGQMFDRSEVPHFGEDPQTDDGLPKSISTKTERYDNARNGTQWEWKSKLASCEEKVL